MRKKKTQEEFISEAVAIHGDKYSYEKTVYAGTDTKVAIWCNVHKVLFWQTPYLHLKGSGCKQCGLDKLSKKFSHTKEQFLEKCRKAHGGRFDYSNVEYINSKTKVEIVCRKHGSFWMTPAAHTGAFKSVCPVCAMQSTISSLQSRSIPFEEFVERARITHGPDKYDYSLANYKGAVHKIQILCKKHNKVFCQQPHKHMTGLQTALDGKLVDAPVDNKQYARKNGTWAEVVSSGGSGQQEVFVQSTQPAATGQPYIWIQTGLPDNGFTFWFEDGL